MTFALGVVSALVAPFLMVVGFIIWDNHWTGSAFALNLYKCNLTAIGFAIVSLYVRYFSGGSFPSDVFTLHKVGALMLSSTIGILIGDWTWLEGMRLLGARKIIVMDSLKPFLAALLGQVFLGERIKLESFFGLILAVVGVSLVAMEQDNPSDQEASESPAVNVIPLETDNLLPAGNQPTDKITKRLDSYAEQRKNRNQSRGELIYGGIMAALNVILHTFGALLTKKFGVGMTTFEINFIRFGFAGLVMAILSGFLSLPRLGSKVLGRTVENSSSSEKPWFQLPEAPGSMWLRISIGVIFVSFLQPALTNYALFQISLALLLTLESIGPLYSLPLSCILQGDKPTLGASIGALLAVVGIMILSFRGMTIDD